MKAFLSYVLLAAAVLSVGSCGRDSSKRSAGAGEPDTVASYWTDSTARKGLYVSSDSTQTASIYLNGAKYYATGTNCYELLLVSLHKKRDAQGRIDLSDSFAALDVLRRNGVGIVRFNCGVYFASELTAYTQNREEYLSALARLAAYAEKLEIGLIPSFFWIYTTVPDYVREPYRSWGIEGSRTTEFLKAYTTDVVEALKPYKSIFAWEFGNEFNLHADLPQYAQRHTQATRPTGATFSGRKIRTGGSGARISFTPTARSRASSAGSIPTAECCSRATRSCAKPSTISIPATG